MVGSNGRNADKDDGGSTAAGRSRTVIYAAIAGSTWSLPAGVVAEWLGFVVGAGA